MIRRLFTIVIAAAGVSGFTPDSVRTHLLPLSDVPAGGYPAPVRGYFRYYGLDFPDTRHRFGTFRSDSFTVAAHLFEPDTGRGTVLIIHGYYDHAGIVRNMIALALDSGFTVAAIDLPGHGLSTGRRSSIEDFSHYARCIAAFLDAHADALPPPLILAGHSTGCAAIIEYLHVYGGARVDRAVLCAPLVRSTYWGWAVTAQTLGGWWLPYTGRWFRNESSDTAWLSWYRGEPLQEHRFPTRWFAAAKAWSGRLDTYEQLTAPVVMIQGDRDDTVDWRYNAKALQTLCRGFSVRMIEGGRHQLANEGPILRDEFLRVLGEEIAGK